MMTWLPLPNFACTAIVLDRPRLDTQRRDAIQVLHAIRNGGGWSRHPIVAAWRGYENALRLYHDVMCREWDRHGWAQDWTPLLPPLAEIVMPPWLGDDRVHSSHRRTLLARDADHYGRLGWEDPPLLGLVWPG